ncbi:ALMS motif [Trinorchestia longiramus]|nr:ALMS motif [Trinorchestia longiramus]
MEQLVDHIPENSTDATAICSSAQGDEGPLVAVDGGGPKLLLPNSADVLTAGDMQGVKPLSSVEICDDMQEHNNCLLARAEVPSVGLITRVTHCNDDIAGIKNFITPAVGAVVDISSGAIQPIKPNVMECIRHNLVWAQGEEDQCIAISSADLPISSQCLALENSEKFIKLAKLHPSAQVGDKAVSNSQSSAETAAIVSLKSGSKISKVGGIRTEPWVPKTATFPTEKSNSNVPECTLVPPKLGITSVVVSNKISDNFDYARSSSCKTNYISCETQAKVQELLSQANCGVSSDSFQHLPVKPVLSSTSCDVLNAKNINEKETYSLDSSVSENTDSHSTVAFRPKLSSGLSLGIVDDSSSYSGLRGSQELQSEPPVIFSESRTCSMDILGQESSSSLSCGPTSMYGTNFDGASLLSNVHKTSVVHEPSKPSFEIGGALSPLHAQIQSQCSSSVLRTDIDCSVDDWNKSSSELKGKKEKITRIPPLTVLSEQEISLASLMSMESVQPAESSERVTSPSLFSISSAASSKRLEWDSAADVGYAGGNRFSSASSLSTLERLTMDNFVSNIVSDESPKTTLLKKRSPSNFHKTNPKSQGSLCDRKTKVSQDIRKKLRPSMKPLPTQKDICTSTLGRVYVSSSDEDPPVRPVLVNNVRRKVKKRGTALQDRNKKDSYCIKCSNNSKKNIPLIPSMKSCSLDELNSCPKHEVKRKRSISQHEASDAHESSNASLHASVSHPTNGAVMEQSLLVTNVRTITTGLTKNGLQDTSSHALSPRNHLAAAHEVCKSNSPLKEQQMKAQTNRCDMYNSALKEQQIRAQTSRCDLYNSAIKEQLIRAQTNRSDLSNSALKEQQIRAQENMHDLVQATSCGSVASCRGSLASLPKSPPARERDLEKHKGIPFSASFSVSENCYVTGLAPALEAVSDSLYASQIELNSEPSMVSLNLPKTFQNDTPCNNVCVVNSEDNLLLLEQVNSFDASVSQNSSVHSTCGQSLVCESDASQNKDPGFLESLVLMPSELETVNHVLSHLSNTMNKHLNSFVLNTTDSTLKDPYHEKLKNYVQFVGSTSTNAKEMKLKQEVAELLVDLFADIKAQQDLASQQQQSPLMRLKKENHGSVSHPLEPVPPAGRLSGSQDGGTVKVHSVSSNSTDSNGLTRILVYSDGCEDSVSLPTLFCVTEQSFSPGDLPVPGAPGDALPSCGVRSTLQAATKQVSAASVSERSCELMHSHLPQRIHTHTSTGHTAKAHVSNATLSPSSTVLNSAVLELPKTSSTSGVVQDDCHNVLRAEDVRACSSSALSSSPTFGESPGLGYCASLSSFSRHSCSSSCSHSSDLLCTTRESETNKDDLRHNIGLTNVEGEEMCFSNAMNCDANKDIFRQNTVVSNVVARGDVMYCSNAEDCDINKENTCRNIVLNDRVAKSELQHYSSTVIDETNRDDSFRKNMKHQTSREKMKCATGVSEAHSDFVCTGDRVVQDGCFCDGHELCSVNSGTKTTVLTIPCCEGRFPLKESGCVRNIFSHAAPLTDDGLASATDDGFKVASESSGLTGDDSFCQASDSLRMTSDSLKHITGDSPRHHRTDNLSLIGDCFRLTGFIRNLMSENMAPMHPAVRGDSSASTAIVSLNSNLPGVDKRKGNENSIKFGGNECCGVTECTCGVSEYLEQEVSSMRAALHAQNSHSLPTVNTGSSGVEGVLPQPTCWQASLNSAPLISSSHRNKLEFSEAPHASNNLETEFMPVATTAADVSRTETLHASVDVSMSGTNIVAGDVFRTESNTVATGWPRSGTTAKVGDRFRSRTTVEVDDRFRSGTTADVDGSFRSGTTAEVDDRFRSGTTAEVDDRFRLRTTAEVDVRFKSGTTAEVNDRSRSGTTAEVDDRSRSTTVTEAVMKKSSNSCSDHQPIPTALQKNSSALCSNLQNSLHAEANRSESSEEKCIPPIKPPAAVVSTWSHPPNTSCIGLEDIGATSAGYSRILQTPSAAETPALDESHETTQDVMPERTYGLVTAETTTGKKGVDLQGTLTPKKIVDLQEPRTPKKSVDLQEPRTPKKSVDLHEPRTPKKNVDLLGPHTPKKNVDLQGTCTPKKSLDLLGPHTPKKSVDLLGPHTPKKSVDLQGPCSPKKSLDLLGPHTPKKSVDLQGTCAPKKNVDLQEPHSRRKSVDLQGPCTPKKSVDLQGPHNLPLLSLTQHTAELSCSGSHAGGEALWVTQQPPAGFSPAGDSESKKNNHRHNSAATLSPESHSEPKKNNRRHNSAATIPPESHSEPKKNNQRHNSAATILPESHSETKKNNHRHNSAATIPPESHSETKKNNHRHNSAATIPPDHQPHKPSSADAAAQKKRRYVNKIQHYVKTLEKLEKALAKLPPEGESVCSSRSSVDSSSSASRYNERMRAVTVDCEIIETVECKSYLCLPKSSPSPSVGPTSRTRTHSKKNFPRLSRHENMAAVENRNCTYTSNESSVESFTGPPVESFTGPPVESFTGPPVEPFTGPPVESFTDPPSSLQTPARLGGKLGRSKDRPCVTLKTDPSGAGVAAAEMGRDRSDGSNRLKDSVNSVAASAGNDAYNITHVSPGKPKNFGIQSAFNLRGRRGDCGEDSWSSHTHSPAGSLSGKPFSSRHRHRHPSDDQSVTTGQHRRPSDDLSVTTGQHRRPSDDQSGSSWDNLSGLTRLEAEVRELQRVKKAMDCLDLSDGTAVGASSSSWSPTESYDFNFRRSYDNVGSAREGGGSSWGTQFSGGQRALSSLTFSVYDASCGVSERACDERACDVNERVCDVNERVCDVNERACDVNERVFDVNERACDVNERACDVSERVCDVNEHVNSRLSQSWRHVDHIRGGSDRTFDVPNVTAELVLFSAVHAVDERRTFDAAHAVDERRTFDAAHAADSQLTFDAVNVADEQQRTSDAARTADEQRTFDAARAADEQRTFDAARTADEQRTFDAVHAADEQRTFDAARAADEQRTFDAARAVDEQRTFDADADADANADARQCSAAGVPREIPAKEDTEEIQAMCVPPRDTMLSDVVPSVVLQNSRLKSSVLDSQPIESGILFHRTGVRPTDSGLRPADSGLRPVDSDLTPVNPVKESKKFRSFSSSSKGRAPQNNSTTSDDLHAAALHHLSGDDFPLMTSTVRTRKHKSKLHFLGNTEGVLVPPPLPNCSLPSCPPGSRGGIPPVVGESPPVVGESPQPTRNFGLRVQDDAKVVVSNLHKHSTKSYDNSPPKLVLNSRSKTCQTLDEPNQIRNGAFETNTGPVTLLETVAWSVPSPFNTVAGSVSRPFKTNSGSVPLPFKTATETSSLPFKAAAVSEPLHFKTFGNPKIPHFETVCGTTPPHFETVGGTTPPHFETVGGSKPPRVQQKMFKSAGCEYLGSGSVSSENNHPSSEGVLNSYTTPSGAALVESDIRQTEDFAQMYPSEDSSVSHQCSVAIQTGQSLLNLREPEKSSEGTEPLKGSFVCEKGETQQRPHREGSSRRPLSEESINIRDVAQSGKLRDSSGVTTRQFMSQTSEDSVGRDSFGVGRGFSTQKNTYFKSRCIGRPIGSLRLVNNSSSSDAFTFQSKNKIRVEKLKSRVLPPPQDIHLNTAERANIRRRKLNKRRNLAVNQSTESSQTSPAGRGVTGVTTSSRRKRLQPTFSSAALRQEQQALRRGAATLASSEGLLQSTPRELSLQAALQQRRPDFIAAAEGRRERLCRHRAARLRVGEYNTQLVRRLPHTLHTPDTLNTLLYRHVASPVLPYTELRQRTKRVVAQLPETAVREAREERKKVAAVNSVRRRHYGRVSVVRQVALRQDTKRAPGVCPDTKRAPGMCPDTMCCVVVSFRKPQRRNNIRSREVRQHEETVQEVEKKL